MRLLSWSPACRNPHIGDKGCGSSSPHQDTLHLCGDGSFPEPRARSRRHSLGTSNSLGFNRLTVASFEPICAQLVKTESSAGLHQWRLKVDAPLLHTSVVFLEPEAPQESQGLYNTAKGTLWPVPGIFGQIWSICSSRIQWH